jgi:hypothetical protein
MNYKFSKKLTEKKKGGTRTVFQRLHDWVTNKKKVLEAVKKDGNALQNAPYFQEDREVVLEAVKQSGEALQYASMELRGDREIVLEAVKQSGKALQFASTKLKNDGYIVTTAINQNNAALQYASHKFKESRQRILNEISPYYYEYPSYLDDLNDLNNDREIVLKALEYTYRYRSSVFSAASNDLKNDRTFVSQALKYEGSLLRYVSKDFQEDRDIVMVAVQQDGLALKFASEDLKMDPEITQKAIEQNPKASKFIMTLIPNLQGDTAYLKANCTDGNDEESDYDIFTAEKKDYKDNPTKYVLIPFVNDPSKPKECYELSDGLIQWITEHGTHPNAPGVKLDPLLIANIRWLWKEQSKKQKAGKDLSKYIRTLKRNDSKKAMMANRSKYTKGKNPT